MTNKQINIPIEKIKPNEHQPREFFEEERLFELAQSIRENGLIQPIVVREKEDHYEIIAGERRYRAMMMIGHMEIPALVIDVEDEKMASLALIENIQRENLSVVEEAKAYKNILQLQQITQKDLAEKMGKSQSSIANKLRLLELNPVVLDSLDKREITERHARALLSLNEEEQEKMLKTILKRGLNVRQTEELIKKPPKKKKVKTKGFSKHIKIGINTVKRSLDMIEKTGIAVNHEVKETDDDIVMIVRFPKE